jgi:hypothetical protein
MTFDLITQIEGQPTGHRNPGESHPNDPFHGIDELVRGHARTSGLRRESGQSGVRRIAWQTRGNSGKVQPRNVKPCENLSPLVNELLPRPLIGFAPSRFKM